MWLSYTLLSRCEKLVKSKMTSVVPGKTFQNENNLSVASTFLPVKYTQYIIGQIGRSGFAKFFKYFCHLINNAIMRGNFTMIGDSPFFWRELLWGIPSETFWTSSVFPLLYSLFGQARRQLLPLWAQFLQLWIFSTSFWVEKSLAWTWIFLPGHDLYQSSFCMLEL